MLCARLILNPAALRRKDSQRTHATGTFPRTDRGDRFGSLWFSGADTGGDRYLRSDLLLVAQRTREIGIGWRLARV